MRSPGHLLARASFGSKGIGYRQLIVTSGSGDIGSVLRLKEHTGRIRTMTTIAKAGNITKDIGTARTMTTAIGASMAMVGAMVSTTTVSMSATTNR